MPKPVLAILALLLAAPPLQAEKPRPATEEEIAKLIADSGKSEDYDGADQVYLLDEADVFVATTGLATTETCQVIKILTDAGVKRQSVLKHDFDPDTWRVKIEAVKVHRKDGGVDVVPLGSMVTQPTPQHMIYWGGKQYLLAIPDLQVGDCLELRIRKVGFNIAYLGQSESGTLAGADELEPPMPGHWHESTLFQGGTPIVRKRYSVHMPKDMPVQYGVYNGELRSSLWFDGDQLVYTFEADDIPAIKREPHMVSLDDCATKVVMATLADWETKSRWFWDVNKNQFQANRAIRQKVAELTRGLHNEDEIIAVLNHWVADNVRYYGTSRGPTEGFTLHTGEETFCDLGGVCKDKAGMLVTMLRAAGVEAYPALTMAGSRVEDIPADQFNHTVTAVKRRDGTFDIYDPTWIPLSREMWSSREAKQALVYGTPEGETLTLSPYYPPDYNGLKVSSKSFIKADGTLETDVKMTMKGYPCTYLRRNLDRYAEPERDEAFAKAIAFSPTALVKQWNAIDPYDYSQDGFVTAEVDAAGYAAVWDSYGLFALPMMQYPLSSWLYPDLFYSVDADSREYGYRMRATRLIEFEETVSLPLGWSIVEAPEAKSIESPAADLKFEIEHDGNNLTYRFSMALKKLIVPADEYAGLKEALEAMQELSEAKVVVRTSDDSGSGNNQRRTTRR